jgi:hypothetical protein
MAREGEVLELAAGKPSLLSETGFSRFVRRDRRKLTAVAGRVAAWSIAHGLARLEAYLFDFVFYPYMLYAGGPSLAHTLGAQGSRGAGYWIGFGILLALSGALNVFYVRLYDASRQDWFGFEALRDRAISWRVAEHAAAPLRIVVFVYLTVWENPLFATLWLRCRRDKFAMSRQDWLLLGGAVVIANVGWTALVSAVARGVAALWG